MPRAHARWRRSPKRPGGRVSSLRAMTVTESRTDEQRVGDLIDELLREHPPAAPPPREFLGAQFDLGLAWVHFPEGHGGLGLSPQAAEARRRAAAGRRRAEPVRPQPDRLRHGRADGRGLRQRRSRSSRYLRPLFTGEEIWCQLFSEPGAGSDVAGLATRGRPRRRRVDRQRPEGVDDARPPVAAGACSSPAPTPRRPSTRA